MLRKVEKLSRSDYCPLRDVILVRPGAYDNRASSYKGLADPKSAERARTNFAVAPNHPGAKSWHRLILCCDPYLIYLAVTPRSVLERTASSFRAPAGGCTLPERMSPAESDLP